jgi:hypothetical protein
MVAPDARLRIPPGCVGRHRLTVTNSSLTHNQSKRTMASGGQGEVGAMKDRPRQPLVIAFALVVALVIGGCGGTSGASGTGPDDSATSITGGPSTTSTTTGGTTPSEPGENSEP